MADIKDPLVDRRTAYGLQSLGILSRGIIPEIREQSTLLDLLNEKHKEKVVYLERERGKTRALAMDIPEALQGFLVAPGVGRRPRAPMKTQGMGPRTREASRFFPVRVWDETITSSPEEPVSREVFYHIVETARSGVDRVQFQINASYKPNTKEVYIDSIEPSHWAKREYSQRTNRLPAWADFENTLGRAELNGLAMQIAKDFPDAEIISGHRVGGTRKKQGFYEGFTSISLAPIRRMMARLKESDRDPSLLFDPILGIGASPEQRNIQRHGFVQMMSPYRYLDLVTMDVDFRHRKRDFLHDSLKSGRKFAQPRLEVKWSGEDNAWVVTGQDGRQRALVLTENRYFGDIPVHVFVDPKDHPHINPNVNLTFISRDGYKRVLDPFLHY